MVDIAKVMGDAPQERETAGTSGRVRVSGLDLSGLPAAIQAAGSLFKKEDQLGADLDRFANLAYDPEAAQADEATNSLAKRLQLMDEQGNLTKAEVARRKQRLMTEFIKKYPGYGDKLAERFSKFKSVLGDITEDADAEVAYQRQQEQERRTGRDRLLRDYGFSPEGMTEAQRQAVFEENVKGSVDRVASAKRRLEELQTEGGIMTEESKIESLRIADQTLDDAYNMVSGEIEEMRDMTFEERRSALTQLKYNVEQQIALFGRGMTPEQRNARYGALLGRIENELKLNDNLDPVTVADRQAKLRDDELRTIRNQNELIKETARARLYTDNGVVAAEVARESLGSLVQSWTKFDQNEVFGGFFGSLTKFTGSAVAQAAKANEQGGTSDRVPANIISKGKFLSPKETVREVGELNKVLQVFHQNEVTPQASEQYGKTVLGALNDTIHGTSLVGLDTMLPTLAQPQAASLIGQSSDVERIAERSNELMPQYINDLSRRIDQVMGADAKYLQIQFDPQGTFRVVPGKKKVGGREVTAFVPRTVKEIERKVNVAVRAYAHMNGITDYLEAGRALFGVEE